MRSRGYSLTGKTAILHIVILGSSPNISNLFKLFLSARRKKKSAKAHVYLSSKSAFFLSLGSRLIIKNLIIIKVKVQPFIKLMVVKVYMFIKRFLYFCPTNQRFIMVGLTIFGVLLFLLLFTPWLYVFLIL